MFTITRKAVERGNLNFDIQKTSNIHLMLYVMHNQMRTLQFGLLSSLSANIESVQASAKDVMETSLFEMIA